MSEIRHRDRILEAIDQLRKRKARPDVNRICSFMFRRFAVNSVETKLDLQKLIDAEVVIKVDYKGNTSYRNAAKWAMLPAYRHKKEIDMSSLISSAVAELIILEPDYLYIGVPESELESFIVQKDNRLCKKNLESILKKEVRIGTLVKLENGNYLLGEHSSNNSGSTMNRSLKVGSADKQNVKYNLTQKQTSRQKKLLSKQNDNSNDSDKMKPEDQCNTSSESANVGSRVGGRQKRARVVFDPSDNNLPTRVSKKRGPGRPLGSLNKSTIQGNANAASVSSSAPSTPTPSPPKIVPSPSPKIVPTPSPKIVTTPKSCVNTGTQVKPFTKAVDVSSLPVNPSLCHICHSYGIRIKGVPERLISCTDCVTRAHPSCLENSNEGLNRDGLWQCLQCKTCAACDETSKAGSLAVCVVCRDAYHYQCHTPHVSERARSKSIPWHCSKCSHSTPLAPAPVKQPVEETPAKEETPVLKALTSPLSPPKKEPPAVQAASPKPPEGNKVKDVPANCLQDPFENIPIDETIPDAKHWTTNQVFQYFSTHLKPELAQVLKDQDIDGQSLLLLKRMDVLTSLNLKVGPALKLYGHVRKLQTRKSHPSILWS